MNQYEQSIPTVIIWDGVSNATIYNTHFYYYVNSTSSMMSGTPPWSTSYQSTSFKWVSVDSITTPNSSSLFNHLWFKVTAKSGSVTLETGSKWYTWSNV